MKNTLKIARAGNTSRKPFDLLNMVRGVTPGKRTPGKSKARRLQDLTTSFKQTKHPNLLRGNKHVAYRTSVNGVKKKASKERKQILGLLQKAQKVAERDPMLCKVKSDWFKKKSEKEKREWSFSMWQAYGMPRHGTDTAADLSVQLQVMFKLPVDYDVTILRHFKKFDENRDEKDSTKMKAGFDAKRRRTGGGRKPMMSEAESAYNAQLRIQGTGSGIATRSVNMLRTISGKPSIVCESTAKRDFARTYDGETRNHQSQKTGKTDLNSHWCVGRRGFVGEVQFRGINRKHMSIHKRGVPSHYIKPKFRMIKLDAGTPHEQEAPRLNLPGMFFLDQKHAKCVFGGVGKKQCRVRVDPVDKVTPMKKANGGAFVPWTNRIKVKFPKEVRFAFGFMTKWIGQKTGPNKGGYRGFVAEPYEYTGKRMLGPKRFKTLVDAEIRRVKTLVTYKKK